MSAFSGTVESGEAAAPGAGEPEGMEPGPVAGGLAAPTVSGCLGAGLAIGLAAAVVYGALEHLLGHLLTPVQTYGERWPAWFIVAAAGRMMTTYALLFVPVTLVLGLIYAAFLRRGRGAAPEPWIAGGIVALVALTILPLDLALAHQNSLIVRVPVVLFGLTVAAGIYGAGRLALRKLGAARLCRTAGIAGVASGAVLAACGLVFVRSPFFSADAYRAPRGSVHALRSARPHVLWIVLDTVRADRLGCYGYGRPTTPFLDELARRAVVFEKAYANGMWTAPTHASMLTQLPPRAHGFGHVTLRLDDRFETLGEIFEQAGYATALYSNNPLVGAWTNLAQGFQRRLVPQEFQRVAKFSIEYLFEALGLTPPVPWFDWDYGAAATNALIADWLDACAGRPTLLLVNYMEAHLPYRVPIRYRRMFMTAQQVHHSYDLRLRLYGDIEQMLNVDANIEGYEHLTPLDRETIRAQYDAALRYLDGRVRELLELYEARGLLENTIVVVTSDHGEHLDTKGMWSHHFLLYQDVLHIPLLIALPGQKHGRRSAALVQHTDLMPTLVRAALGRDITRPGLGGTRDVLAPGAEDAPGQVAVAECFGPEPAARQRLASSADPVRRHRACSQRAVFDGRYKYIVSSDGERELYDLDADPQESRNLAAQQPLDAARLERILDAWLRAVPEYERPADASDRHRQDVLRTLRALGYVGDGGD